MEFGPAIGLTSESMYLPVFKHLKVQFLFYSYGLRCSKKCMQVRINSLKQQEDMVYGADFGFSDLIFYKFMSKVVYDIRFN